MKKSEGFVRLLRSAIALLLAFFAVLALSVVAHDALHRLGLVGGWGQVYDIRANLLTVTYRATSAVVGSYIAARLAPGYPMLHAMTLGLVVLALSTWHLVITLTYYDVGPPWPPATLAVAALPYTWLGGYLRRSQDGEG